MMEMEAGGGLVCGWRDWGQVGLEAGACSMQLDGRKKHHRVSSTMLSTLSGQVSYQKVGPGFCARPCCTLVSDGGAEGMPGRNLSKTQNFSRGQFMVL